MKRSFTCVLTVWSIHMTNRKTCKNPTATRMALAYHCMLTLGTIFTWERLPGNATASPPNPTGTSSRCGTAATPRSRPTRPRPPLRRPRLRRPPRPPSSWRRRRPAPGWAWPGPPETPRGPRPPCPRARRGPGRGPGRCPRGGGPRRTTPSPGGGGGGGGGRGHTSADREGAHLQEVHLNECLLKATYYATRCEWD